jgi:hypothetical protein
LLALVLFASFCAADFVELNAGGDAEVAVNSDDWLGSIFSGIPGTAAVYGGGTSSWLVRPKPVLYDVIVHMAEPAYEPGDDAKAKIEINNTGDLADNDTILTYFLITSDGKIIEGSKQQFLEVPPGRSTIYRKITIPETAQLGRYKFVVVYETTFQPRITVYDTFDVIEAKPRDFRPVIYIIGGAGLLLMFLRRLRYHGVI